MRSYRKPLSVLLGLLIIPLILTGVLFFLLWLDTDHEQLKGQLQSWFNRQTGYHLEIQGPLQMQLFPAFDFSASQARLTDDSQNTLLNFGELVIAADLISLIQGKLNVHKIEIHQAELNVTHDKDGNLNIAWQTQAGKTETEFQGITRLPVETIELVDSKLRYHDQQKNISFNLSGINIQLKTSGDNQHSLQITTAFKTLDNFEGQIKADGKITLQDFIDVNQLTVQLNTIRNKVALNASLSGDLRFSQTGDFIQASDINLASNELGLKASFNVAALEEGFSLSAAVSGFQPAEIIPFFDLGEQLVPFISVISHVDGEFEIRSGKNDLSVEFHSLTINEAQAQGKLSINDDLLGIKLKIDELDAMPYLKAFGSVLTHETADTENQRDIMSSVQINSLKLQQGRIEQFVHDLYIKNGKLQSINGSMQVSHVNPANLLKLHGSLLPEEIRSAIRLNDNVLQYFNGAIGYRFATGSLELTGMDLTVDDTSISGDLAYDFSKPEITANLTIDEINVDRYLELVSQDDQTGSDDVDDTVSGFVNWLKQTQGQGKVNIGSLTYQATTYQDINVHFNSE